MRSFPLLTAALLVTAVPARAQDTSSKDKNRTPEPDRRVWIESGVAPRALRVFAGADMMGARSMIGVSTSSSGIRDTLGLLVTSVTPNGPAEKAGIVEGNRIAAINGVNLRLNAADAGEPDMQGITARRLTRELGKVDPGKDVELRLWADGQWKTVRVKTVARDSLMPARYRSSDIDDRAVLGFSLNSTGSKRDTLGVLIGSLTEDGPAEKAGLIEGDRVVSVNGTDLRVPREDAGDDWVSSSMVNRFQRVMRSVKPGDKVQLRVWSGGQTKNVAITAAKASELYKSEGRFRMGPMSISGDWAPFIAPVPAIPPVPPVPAIAPRIRINSFDMDDEDIDDASANVDVDRALEEARAADAKAASRARASTRALMSSAANLASTAPVAAAVWSPDMASAELMAADARSSGQISIPGLSLAPVTKELAEYLGKGSEDGYLVLESSGNWGALHAGDVIIAIDGSSMRDGGVISTEGGHDYTVLRKGRKVSLRM